MKWTRESDGLYRSGRWSIQRHVDDDPGNLFGDSTHWILKRDDVETGDLDTRLGDAKKRAERYEQAAGGAR